MAIETKYGNPDIPGIPADEPVFILRAQDVATLATLADYHSHAKAHGAESNFLDEVEDAIGRFITWQENNQGKVKKPD